MKQCLHDKNYMRRRIVWFSILPVLFCFSYPYSSFGDHSLQSSDFGGLICVSLGVPYLDQKENYCGPAALEMVYKYYGLNSVAQEEISENIYRKKFNGSLNLELLFDARERGFHAEMYKGSFEDIKKHINADEPLILMLELKNSCHYVVAVGYDKKDGSILCHTGYEKKRRYSMRYLRKLWKPTGYCTILIRPAKKKEAKL